MMMPERKILSDDVVPLYQQIESVLEECIRKGELKPTEKLPSEKELAEKFNVSTITIKKAISILVEKGMLARKQGKGTFVTTVKLKRDLHRVISFTESCRMSGTKPGSKVLEQSLVKISSEIKEELATADDTAILITRLRFVDDKPMVLESNWFPMAFKFLLQQDLNNSSLFEVLKEKVGLEMSSANRTVEIVEASSHVASLLDVEKGTPLLFVKSVVYTSDGNTVFVGTQTINAERFKLII